MAVHVLPDADVLARYAADVIANELTPGGSLALAGGGTPAATYRALRSHAPPWSRIDVWMGDERWVALDHPDCNSRMALDELGEEIGGPLLPVPFATGATPEERAAHYEGLLRQRLGDSDGVIRPDVVLLGIGDDAHTASLFPGSAALEVTDRDYVANWLADKGVWRLTATIPLLHRSRLAIFLVQGPGKAGALKEVLEGPGTTPAALVASGAQHVLWIVDAAAAASLEATPLVHP